MEDSYMPTIRHIVDGKLLNNLISLPESFHSIKLEVTITPAVEEKSQPSLTRSKLRTMLKGSVTESLSGSLPRTDMTIEDFRAERLKKFERTD
jgi:hypothetical protein